MTTTSTSKPVCPRCHTDQCFGPDDKSCSDQCLSSLQSTLESVRRQLARILEFTAEKPESSTAVTLTRAVMENVCQQIGQRLGHG
jgi:hypothetical protein